MGAAGASSVDVTRAAHRRATHAEAAPSGRSATTTDGRRRHCPTGCRLPRLRQRYERRRRRCWTPPPPPPALCRNQHAARRASGDVTSPAVTATAPHPPRRNGGVPPLRLGCCKCVAMLSVAPLRSVPSAAGSRSPAAAHSDALSTPQVPAGLQRHWGRSHPHPCRREAKKNKVWRPSPKATRRRRATHPPAPRTPKRAHPPYPPAARLAAPATTPTSARAQMSPAWSTRGASIPRPPGARPNSRAAGSPPPVPRLMPTSTHHTRPP